MANEDAGRALNDLYLKYGSDLRPGDDIDFRDLQVKVEQDVRFTQLIKNTVDWVNENGFNSVEGIANPFCNQLIQLFQKLDHVVEYFCGEFQIQTKDKHLREAFAGIWREFIKGWYFGSIYIAYGEDFEEIDKQKFKREGKDFFLEGIPGKFRLYMKSSENTFHSILSGQSGLKFSDEMRSKMVKCESKGLYRWMHWMKIWSERQSGINRASAAIKALSKNWVLTPKSEAEATNITEQFQNYDSFIRREGSNVYGGEGTAQMGKSKMEAIVFMPRENPMAILEGVQRIFELESAHLGYAYEFPSQKKERKNAGENYPHQKVVANVRTQLISSLNYAFDQMRIRFGSKKKQDPYGQELKEDELVIPLDLKIVPANQAEAMGLPNYNQGGTFDNFGNQGWNNKFGFQKPWFNNRRDYDYVGND